MSKWPKISSDKAVQSEYVAMRKRGVSHNLAEMFALQAAPSLQTDTRFQMGVVNHRQFGSGYASERVGKLALRKAKQAGVSVEGARYSHQLARFPGDPEAWIRDRSDVKRIAERRGMQVEGSVNYTPKHALDAPEKPYRVAKDIVDNAVLDEMEKNPGIEKDVPDLRQQVEKRLNGHYAESTITEQ